MHIQKKKKKKWRWKQPKPAVFNPNKAQLYSQQHRHCVCHCPKLGYESTNYKLFDVNILVFTASGFNFLEE